MADNIFVVAITAPGIIKNEISRISEILENGEADIIHIRKPDWTLKETDELIRRIPSKWHPRLRLHDHFRLLEHYSLAGIHLNSRNPDPHPLALSVTKSCHTIEQLEESAHYDYITLSPIFDSISKTGYRSAFNLDALSPHLEGKNVVALGGITPDKFPVLKKAGFFGAAMLGYFWE